MAVLSLLAVFRFHSRNDTAYRENQIRHLEIALQVTLNAQEDNSRFTFDAFVNRPEILSLYAGAVEADSAGKAAVRKELYDALLPVYLKLKKTDVKQFHFHDPANCSFLRFHRPGKFGDDLTNIRYSVVLANREQRVVTGFEEGRIFNGFRFVYPMSWEGRHIGTVEISTGYMHIVQRLQRDFPGEYSFIIREDIVRNKLFGSELSNAIDAMPEGGEIVLTVERAEEDGHRICSFCGERILGSYIKFSVRDQGIGIKEKEIPHIFEPFYTTKDVNRGVGLGLSQVQGLVTRQGGHLQVQSRENAGSEISIYFAAFPSSVASADH